MKLRANAVGTAGFDGVALCTLGDGAVEPAVIASLAEP
jgi:hypothetical protein